MLLIPKRNVHCTLSYDSEKNSDPIKIIIHLWVVPLLKSCVKQYFSAVVKSIFLDDNILWPNKCFEIVIYCLFYLYQGVCTLTSCLKFIISLCSTHMSSRTGLRTTNQSPEFRNGQLSCRTIHGLFYILKFWQLALVTKMLTRKENGTNLIYS